MLINLYAYQKIFFGMSGKLPEKGGFRGGNMTDSNRPKAIRTKFHSAVPGIDRMVNESRYRQTQSD